MRPARFLLFPLVTGLAWGQAVTLSQAPPIAQPAPAAPQQYKPEELCTIAGIVRNAVTGEPLRKAEVMLMRVEPRNPQPPARTSTNAEGRFAMKAIEPGQYRLSVTRNGFVRSEYGARKPGSLMGGTTLSLSKGQTLDTIEFRLSPHSVITGRIVDEDGDPVMGASVQLVRPRYFQGRKQMLPMSNAMTNDLGEYRLFGVAPGKYYLSVTGRQSYNYAVDRTASSKPEEGYAPTYYPGVENIASATQLNVPLGRAIQGVDVTLRKTLTFRVKGKVTGAPSGSNRPVMISLTAKDEDMLSGMPRMMSSANRQNGEFELSGVRLGSYVLQAVSPEGPNEVMSGRLVIEVTDHDLDNLTVSLSPGGEVQGSIRMEGEGSLNMRDLSVYLQPGTRSFMMGNTNVRVKEDGAFVIPNAPQDLFDVRVSGAPPEFYVKSIRLGEIDVLGNGLDLTQSASASGLDIVLSPTAAQLEGSVVDEKGDPVRGATVTLRPTKSEPAALVSQLLKSITTDQNGAFRIRSITPGEYNLLAFDGVDTLEAQDPDLFQEHSADAVKLVLKDSARETKQLKVVSLQDKP
ncbi:MAG: carboxypeptidase regulatory-like domain-containing protein [Bryobacterales bacterium]|nr:carboxypeptidase regulatory-like domain-containing protein [Bryobacterales bacterium]